MVGHELGDESPQEWASLRRSLLLWGPSGCGLQIVHRARNLELARSLGRRLEADPAEGQGVAKVRRVWRGCAL